MKQTAVDWLADEMLERFRWIMDGSDEKEYQTLVEKAKKMEREQIIEAFDEGQQYEYEYHFNGTPKFDSETYFIETYKGGEQ